MNYSFGRFISCFAVCLWLMGGEVCSQGQAPAAAPAAEASAGPVDILKAGNAAYLSQNWAEAAKQFDQFLEAYGTEPTAAEAVAQVKPLLCLSRIRLRDYAAAGQLVSECLALPKLEPKLKDELAFWKGVILLQMQEYDLSRTALLGYFQIPEFNEQRRVETLLLYGTTYVLEGKLVEAAAFFEQQSARLWQMNQEAAMRGQTLRLHCLLELGELDKAKEIVRAAQPLLAQVTQIVSLQGLTAELGGRFLEKEDYYSAIFCLQRVWPAQRLLKHQTERIARLQAEIEALKARAGTEPQVFQKQSVMTRVEREHRTFAANASFDLAVRMRLGFSYLGLGRWREAALVLEEAVQLPGDPVQQAQAGMAVVQCWHELKRYDRAVAAADVWLAKFEEKAAPTDTAKVRFLLAQARYDAQDFSEAAKEFEALAVKLPKEELVPQAMLMAGLAHLMADDTEAAVTQFKELLRRFDHLPAAEDADYWLGMALSFDKQYQPCRDHLERHLKKYAKSGRYAPAAEFKRAYCLFAVAQYDDAIAELQEYQIRHPQGADIGEAEVLRGDALCSLGQIDEGLASYEAVSVSDDHWYDEAQFKIGNVWKLRQDWPALQAHYEAFAKARPDSKKLAEAVYWMGFASESMDQHDEARALYWRALDEHGDVADRYGVEDILLALPRLYRGENQRVELVREIQRKRTEAEKQNRPVMVCRLNWMEGHMQPPDKPELSYAGFLMAAQTLNVKRQNPRIIADCADASREAGSKVRAKELYTELIRWHPRAVEVERAYAGLGFLAEAAGEWQAALDNYARFEKRAVSMDLIPRVALRKAALLGDHRKISEATEIYKGLLSDKLTPTRAKAEALLAWGGLLEKQNQLLPATAYYERVYVGYGRHLDLVAKAYLARAKALEKLGKKREAHEVYAECSRTAALTAFPEFTAAEQRMNELGPLPPAPVNEAKVKETEVAR